LNCNQAITVSLAQLAERVQGKVVGDPECQVTGLAPLSEAGPGQISFLANPRYRPYLSSTRAAAVLIHEKDLDQCQANAIVCDDPYLAYARISHLFDRRQKASPGIHPLSHVEQPELLGKEVSVAPFAVIGPGVVIGEGTSVGSGVCIGAHSKIGKMCVLHPGSVVMDYTEMGDRVTLQPGAIIGGDGFGYARHQSEGWVKIAQIGRVILHDDVEVGSGTTIDRGAMGDTVIGRGVKIDNQIQIGHNVVIGEYTALAASTAVAGSTRIGAHCTIAGKVAISGHLTICDHVFITGMSMITRSIAEPGVYSSGLHAMEDSRWKRNQARFRELDSLAKRLQKLEKWVRAKFGD
jgi:UDP-3-O-[3-hydroxymyristoyl] glucosamine N-acyltransferase